MLVVTGEAGAGKSALLGRLVVLADPPLSAALARAGLLGDVDPMERPPADAFDVVVHLTGKTLADCVRRVADALPELAGVRVAEPETLISALRHRAMLGRQKPFTVLADALDEAQQPDAIAASLLRRLATTPGIRVLVGTRRSRLEGPDLAAPSDRGLLDSLGVSENELLVVGRDSDAVRRYAEARLAGALSSPFSADPARRRAADLIADRDQPFLFARLAVSELLARPHLASDPSGQRRLLDRGHRGLFAAAIERLDQVTPSTSKVLRTLAFGLGRGLPRAGGVWAAANAALVGQFSDDEEVIDRALREAAAFIMLDGEDGQSTYRLAHQTFAEHFWSDPEGEPDPVHRAVARALMDLVRQRGGWAVANPYVTRRLARHAALGGVLADVLDDPDATDHLQIVELRDAVLDAFFGRGEIPTAALAVLREAETLSAIAPQDRGVLRALVSLVDRPGTPPSSVSTASLLLPVIATGAPVTPHLTLRAHAFGVKAITVGLLRDGRAVLASGGWEGTVQLWDAATGARIGEPLMAHERGVHALALGNFDDGRDVLASGGGDGAVRLWDPLNGLPIGEPLQNHETVSALVLGTSTKGRAVVVCGDYQGAIRLWDLERAQLMGQPLLGHKGPVWAVAMLTHTDGRPLAVSGAEDGTVRVWDLERGQLLGQPMLAHHGGVRGLAVDVSAGGRRVVVSGGMDGAVRLWDAERGRPIDKPIRAHPGGVLALGMGALADGRKSIVTGGVDGMVRLWDVAGGSLGEPLRGHRRAVWEVALFALADGRTVLATGGYDGAIRLWDPARGAPTGPPIPGHRKAVLAVAVGRMTDGRRVVASAGSDGAVRLWDPDSGAVIGGPLRGHTGPVRAISIGALHDGQSIMVSGGQDGTVQRWSPDRAAIVGSLIDQVGAVRALAVCAMDDGRVIVASGGDDGNLQRWDFLTGSSIGKPMKGHDGRVHALATGALADGRPVVASAGDDGTIRLWDLTRGTFIVGLRGHRGSVRAIAMSTPEHGRSIVASAGKDGTVRLWDPDTGIAIGTPWTVGATLWAVGLGTLADGRPVVVSGGYDREVRVWDLATGTTLSRIPMLSPVNDLAMHLGLLCVATAGGLVVFSVGPFSPRSASVGA